jgi:mannose-6-phosphate isomerase
MYQMRNPIRRYDWGSTDAIPELLGRRPDGRPQAELWMGAYESESSQVRIDRRWHDLAAVLRARGEPRLPFLAKVTAIGSPLSLQIHPVGGTDAKTEMLYAWQPCRVLCGFRDVASVRALLGDLRGVVRPDRPTPVVDALLHRAGSQDGLRDGLATLLHATGPTEVADLRDRLRLLPRWPGVADAVEGLAAHHDGDPAVLAPLLLSDVELSAGEALVCRPGQPHTYLSGVGIEVQSNSDAVVRAGLTSKPTDVDAFVAGLVTDRGPDRVAWRSDGPERVFAVPGVDFALGVVGDVTDGPIGLAPAVGAQILLCAEGVYTVQAGQAELELRPGESAFVPSGRPDVVVSGKGCLFRISAGRTVAVGT